MTASVGFSSAGCTKFKRRRLDSESGTTRSVWRLNSGKRIGPALWMQRRFELVRAEDSQGFSGRGHLQHQSDLKPGSLEVRHANPMDAAAKAHTALSVFRRMLTVIVDDELIVDVKPGAVIGSQNEAVGARIVDPKPAGIVNREPFKSFCHAGEAVPEILWRNIEGGSVDGADRLQPAKIREPVSVTPNPINAAAESGWNYDCSAEFRNRFLNCRQSGEAGEE